MQDTLSSSAFIRCSVYTDLLPNGTKSPGFVPVFDENGFCAAWVVPQSSLNNWNMRGYINKSIPKDGPVEKAAWANENIRLVQIVFPGAIFTPDPELYEVWVPSPFRNATFGILDSKRGAEIQLSVPEGDTLQSILRDSMTNLSVPLATRLKIAQAHFKTPDGLYRGVAGEVGEPKFPKKGDKWS